MLVERVALLLDSTTLYDLPVPDKRFGTGIIGSTVAPMQDLTLTPLPNQNNICGIEYMDGFMICDLEVPLSDLYNVILSLSQALFFSERTLPSP